MSDEEWGPWQHHDGTCYPVRKGDVIEVVFADGTSVVEVSMNAGFAWFWDECEGLGEWDWKIIRYRIRRFRAEQTLREIAENIREVA